MQQCLKIDPENSDRHVVTLLQPWHIVTLLCWAWQNNGGGERSKFWTACSAEHLILLKKCKLTLNAINGSLFGLYDKFSWLLAINIIVVAFYEGTKKKKRFPQKWKGIIFYPLLSALGVIVIFSELHKNTFWIEHWRMLDLPSAPNHLEVYLSRITTVTPAIALCIMVLLASIYESWCMLQWVITMLLCKIKMVCA